MEWDRPNLLFIPRGHPSLLVSHYCCGLGPANRAIRVTLFGCRESLKWSELFFWAPVLAYLYVKQKSEFIKEIKGILHVLQTATKCTEICYKKKKPPTLLTTWFEDKQLWETFRHTVSTAILTISTALFPEFSEVGWGKAKCFNTKIQNSRFNACKTRIF